MSTESISIGERIKQVRTENKLSQAELADKFKMTNANISNMEKGKAYPTVETLVNIATLFNVSLEWLITGKDSEAKMPNHTSNAILINEPAPGYATFADLPIVPIAARATFVETLQNDENYSAPQTIRVYDLESQLLKKNPIVIEINGDSMEPQLKNGMKVLALPVDKGDYAYQSSRIVAVVFRDYFVVKRIKSNNLMENGTLTIYSDKDDSSMTINEEDIYGMWQVVRALPHEIV